MLAAARRAGAPGAAGGLSGSRAASEGDVTSGSAFDYVIVGAGSAGCVLAHRLSADPALRVLLLEAGGADRSPLIRAPGGLLPIMMSGAFSWG